MPTCTPRSSTNSSSAACLPIRRPGSPGSRCSLPRCTPAYAPSFQPQSRVPNAGATQAGTTFYDEAPPHHRRPGAPDRHSLRGLPPGRCPGGDVRCHGPGAGHLFHPDGRTQLRSPDRSEEHTSELQSHLNLVCRLLLEKKKQILYCVSVHKRKNTEINTI